MRVVAALGGNALSPPLARGSVDEMRHALVQTCGPLADLVAEGVELVLTHGNGPQIGRILLQQDAAAAEIPPMPMDVCGAQSQGQIGYLLAQALDNALRARGISRSVLCLLTQVVVNGRDPAFRRPTKPVGPTYGADDARRVASERGHVLANVSTGEWRRVVASPRPIRFVEEAALRQVVAAGLIVVAGGGGGVPVVDESGVLRGVDAVVDKDRSAGRLAEVLGADVLAIVTQVPHVQTGFGTPDAQALHRLTVDEGQALLAAGEFPEGSMGPKVESACAFVAQATGRRAVITDLAGVREGVKGDGGTQFVP